MSFVRYHSLSRFGNKEVEGIEVGQCYIFPKIDGTNASMCFDPVKDKFCFGSRNRQLTREQDNAGFMAAMEDGHDTKGYFDFCKGHPHLILFGEWLVPHTIKDYRDEAWKKFYVFDVYDRDTMTFMPFADYEEWMKIHKMHYIPCFKTMRNPSFEDLLFQANNIKFLLRDETCVGEGIVIKNYGWENKFHDNGVWAKIVTAEFKDKHVLEMGGSEAGGICNEEKLVDAAVTAALIEKEYAKIVNENEGWSRKYIPRLLETVFYCLIKEDFYDTLKVINFGTVNFKTLKTFTVMKIKQVKPELF